MIGKLREFLETLEPVNTYRLFKYTEEAYKEKRCYAQVPLEKKNGGIRILQVPNKKMKRLQRELLRYFQHAEISPCAAAYVKGRTLLDHAWHHTDSRIVVKLDIEDFFGSITFSMVFRAVDEVLNSDDLIFSGDFRPLGLISFVRKLLAQNGFTLNEDKIVIAGNGRQQKITGVVVNRRPQADRKYRREIRQDIYYIGRYGLEEHLQRKGLLLNDSDKTTQLVKELQKLIGRIAFVLQIDPENEEFKNYKEISIRLLNRIPMIWNS